MGAGYLYIDPTSNWKRIKEENVEEYVKPIKMDAREIPFPEK